MVINVNNKKLTELPQLSSHLIELYCYKNLLTELPQLFFLNRLKYLDCSVNLLAQLPTLPPNLTNLCCYNNPLTQLPPLPPSLKMIWISTWQLKSCLNNVTNPKTHIKIVNW